MKYFLVAFCFVTALVSEEIVDKCKLGQTYWCKSKENAIKCGMFEFCKASKIRFHPLEKTVALKIQRAALVPGVERTYIKFHPNIKTPKKKMKPNDAPPVHVGFYYESLCPGCKEVWQTQLFPTFQKLGSTGIVKFDFVPYGNAQERSSGSTWIYYCQHGTAECIGNLIETCALHFYPNPNQHIPFLHCLEYYGPTATNGKYCGSLSNMTYSDIDTCVNGDLGNSLEHEMALKTEALNPPHQYVPWLTLNGQPSSALASDMLETICNAYTGTKPQACNAVRRACYKGQNM